MITDPEDPYGCVMFCRAPGGRICPKCEPALYAQFYPSASEGRDA